MARESGRIQRGILEALRALGSDGAGTRFLARQVYGERHTQSQRDYLTRVVRELERRGRVEAFRAGVRPHRRWRLVDVDP